MIIKRTSIIDRVWGYEEKISNGKGRILHLREGYESSFHRHEEDETLYVQSGRVYLQLEESGGKLKEFFLDKQELVDIPSYTWHKFSGLEDSVIIKISSPDGEIERKNNGGEIPQFQKWRTEKLNRMIENKK